MASQHHSMLQHSLPSPLNTTLDPQTPPLAPLQQSVKEFVNKNLEVNCLNPFRECCEPHEVHPQTQALLYTLDHIPDSYPRILFVALDTLQLLHPVEAGQAHVTLQPPLLTGHSHCQPHRDFNNGVCSRAQSCRFCHVCSNCRDNAHEKWDCPRHSSY